MVIADVEGELTQFVSNRDKKYLKVLANHVKHIQ